VIAEVAYKRANSNTQYIVLQNIGTTSVPLFDARNVDVGFGRRERLSAADGHHVGGGRQAVHQPT
jgi:hypothetical protein